MDGAAYKNKWEKLFLEISFVFLTVCAAMGEWKVVNQMLGGLPKAVCGGIIFLAIAHAFARPNAKRLKQLTKPTLVYLSLIAFLMLWSLVIWIMNFAELSSVVRGGSKMMYQTICILTAVSGVYLFGGKSVDLFALGLCITNGTIMLLEIPNYGLSASIDSLINCVVKFGDAVGYARALEIHDLTFVFGQLIIYYAVFSPRKTAAEKKRTYIFLAACTFFFVVGMKRIAIPAVVLFVLLAAVLKNRKKPAPFFIAAGIGMTVFFFLFIYGVKSGAVSKICHTFGIDMMGREYLWFLAGDYYEISPLYMGRGFEFVDTVVKQWYNQGILKVAYMFHNDILKVFVEMGFPGFLVWSVSQYVAFPIFFLKYADAKAASLYFAELGYMTVTYLTDNTAFYFWSTLGLKLVVLGYAFYRKSKKKQEPQKWVPPSKEDVKSEIRRRLLEQHS